MITNESYATYTVVAKITAIKGSKAQMATKILREQKLVRVREALIRSLSNKEKTILKTARKGGYDEILLENICNILELDSTIANLYNHNERESFLPEKITFQFVDADGTENFCSCLMAEFPTNILPKKSIICGLTTVKLEIKTTTKKEITINNKNEIEEKEEKVIKVLKVNKID